MKNNILPTVCYQHYYLMQFILNGLVKMVIEQFTHPIM